MNKKITGYLCLVFICLVWGTTYLFTRIAVVSFPAFLFAGIRNVSAGVILLMLLAFSKHKFPWTWSSKPIASRESGVNPLSSARSLMKAMFKRAYVRQRQWAMTVCRKWQLAV